MERGKLEVQVADIFEDLPFIETDRLLLRKMQMGDASDVFEYASDPKVLHYAIWPAHNSIEDSKLFINLVMDKLRKHQVLRWGIVHKADMKLIGTVALFNWIRKHGWAEIGYALSSKYWGCGYMTEAVVAAIAFGFDTMKLNRIHGKCKVSNFASARVMEKAGMKFDGILRQHKFEKGLYHDLKGYSILKSEFSL